MCEYCDTSEWRGKSLTFIKYLDGKNQDLEVCIYDSPEDAGKVLEIEGTYTELRAEIKYCPMCGKEL